MTWCGAGVARGEGEGAGDSDDEDAGESDCSEPVDWCWGPRLERVRVMIEYGTGLVIHIIIISLLQSTGGRRPPPRYATRPDLLF